MWYEDRAFQLLIFSMLQEVKKGRLAPWTIESSKIFIFNVFTETNAGLFTCGIEAISNDFTMCRKGTGRYGKKFPQLFHLDTFLFLNHF